MSESTERGDPNCDICHGFGGWWERQEGARRGPYPWVHCPCTQPPPETLSRPLTVSPLAYRRQHPAPA